MTQSLNQWQGILEQKKAKLDDFRPLPTDLVKNLNQWFSVELNYNSNALEGNTLSKRETNLVIEKGLTIGGKSVKEHLEVLNFQVALNFIEDLAKKKRKDITLNNLLDIHHIILKGIDDTNAGFLRKIPLNIAGSEKVLPSPFQLQNLMNDFIQWLTTVQGFIVKIAAEAHFRFVAIHPFVDGNGRTARLLMNLLLLQEGYPPAIVEMKKRREYIEAIAKGEETGDLTDFYLFIYKAENFSLDKFLNAAEQLIS